MAERVEVGFRALKMVSQTHFMVLQTHFMVLQAPLWFCGPEI